MTRARLLPLIVSLLLLCRCGGEQSPRSAAPSSTSPDAVRQAVSDMRSKPLLVVVIRDAAAPAPDEEKLRRAFEDKVEQQHIGTVTDQTIGGGYVAYTIQVEDTVKAIPQVRALLQQSGFAERSTIQVRAKE